MFGVLVCVFGTCGSSSPRTWRNGVKLCVEGHGKMASLWSKCFNLPTYYVPDSSVEASREAAEKQTDRQARNKQTGTQVSRRRDR